MTSTLTSAAVTGDMTSTARPAAPVRRTPPLPGQVISWPTRRPAPAVQGALALDLPPHPAGHEQPVLAAPPGSARTRSGGPAEQAMRARAARFSMAVLEAVGGDRPVTQLLRWTTAEVYAGVVEHVRRLERDAALRTGTERPRLVSVHVSTPADDVAEVSSHLRQGRRSRALALRLEAHRDRWICTALRLG